MKKQRWSWGKAYLALVFVILYAPILYLVVFSFSSGQTMEKYHGFSWQHYADLLADTRMITIVINTLLVAFLASLLATIIGTLGALAIKDARRPWKNSLLSLNNVLMVSPDVIIGASFLIFFTMLGVRLGEKTSPIESIGTGCSTLERSLLISPPTLWVIELAVTKSGNCSSNSTNS